MHTYIVTVTAADRVGIVHSVTGTIRDRRGNILELSQTVMRGYFTIIVAVEFDQPQDPEALGAAVAEAGKEFELTVAVREATEADIEPPVPNGERFILTVLGVDHPGNIHGISGCLTRLGALASVTGLPITIEFACQAVRDLMPAYESKPDIEAIQRVVSDSFHIPLMDLKSKKRTQHVTFCRQVAMYLCRKITNNSFPSIGEHFGRDHSTVIHACNLIERRVNNDSAFRFLIEKMERGLKHVPTSVIPGDPKDSGPSVGQAGG